MARFPGAVWKPVDRYKPGGSSHVPMATANRLIYHTAVFAGDSLFDLFNVSGNPVAHFYVREDGTVEQYVDTDTRASAVLEGNYDCITVESWDDGAPGGHVPDWTDAQVDACARIAAWCHTVHGIPMDLLDSSSPGHGVGWHRLGIDGNFPSGLLHGRRSGGELWSTSTGKQCPGDLKIKGVVNAILPLARDLVNGDDMANWEKTEIGQTGKSAEGILARLDRFMDNEADFRAEALKDLEEIEQTVSDAATKKQIQRLRAKLEGAPA